MSETKHTPEPWRECCGDDRVAGMIRGGNGENIINWRGVAQPMTTGKANVQRIVSCVNACKGISNGALEAGVVQDMLAALQDCVSVLACDLESPAVAKYELRQAKAAIAKAKGE